MKLFQIFTIWAMDALKKKLKDRLCRLSFLQKHNFAILFERCLTSAKEDKVCPLSRTFHCSTEGWNWPVFRSSSHSCSLTFCSIALLLLGITSLEFSDSPFTFFLSLSLSLCLCFPLSSTHSHLLVPLSPLLLLLLSQCSSKLSLAHLWVLHTHTLGGFLYFCGLAITPKQKVRDQSSSLVWTIFTKFKHSISKCLLGHCYWLIITEIMTRQQIYSLKVIFIISTIPLFPGFHQCVVRIAISHPIQA